eukprot:scaffold65062_cov58-Phaeocystis_antarctica.AAC.1
MRRSHTHPCPIQTAFEACTHRRATSWVPLGSLGGPSHGSIRSGTLVRRPGLSLLSTQPTAGGDAFGDLDGLICWPQLRKFENAATLEGVNRQQDCRVQTSQRLNGASVAQPATEHRAAVRSSILGSLCAAEIDR